MVMKNGKLSAIALGLMLMLCALHAQAAGVVSTCDEPSLKTALLGGGAVTFTCSGRILLTSAITISTNTIIDGSGQNIIIESPFQVIGVNVGIGLVLNHLYIAGGSATAGGAIYSSGNLKVTDTTFWANTAKSAGGAIVNNYFGLFTNCTFLGNTAQWGGAIINTGKMTVTGSTFVANNAAVGAASSICSDA